jgi:protein SCO1
MRRKLIFYTGFFVVLFVLFYVTLTKIIPGYGEVKLPVLNEVQPFFFTSQDGKIISQKDVAGKVYVAEYFFTTCKGICPKMNNNMKEIYADFKDEPDFRILSHTVDPETDTVARMKCYADSMKADSKTWLFLTGRKDSLYRAARVSYLLDENGDVRKIADGLKKDEIAELKTDIEKLLKEKPGINHFSSPLNGNNVH